MMKDPLLRSTGVLGGLFHEGVVVGENDGDRSLYQEVNHRLSVAGRSSAENTLFLNAHEKSTVRKILRPLREMGIPSAGIVDLGIIKNRDFNDLLKAAFVPETLVDTSNVHRSRIDAKFEEMGADMKACGIDALPKEEKEAAQMLIDNVAKYGIFVVPVGELEQWFPQLKSRGDRPRKSHHVPWVFELMNTDPDLFPITEDDVWKFVGEIGAWISDPERKGIPA
jgi:hypothetical protein